MSLKNLIRIVPNSLFDKVPSTQKEDFQTKIP